MDLNWENVAEYQGSDGDSVAIYIAQSPETYLWLVTLNPKGSFVYDDEEEEDIYEAPTIIKEFEDQQTAIDYCIEMARTRHHAINKGKKHYSDWA